MSGFHAAGLAELRQTCELDILEIGVDRAHDRMRQPLPVIRADQELLIRVIGEKTHLDQHLRNIGGLENGKAGKPMASRQHQGFLLQFG